MCGFPCMATQRIIARVCWFKCFDNTLIGLHLPVNPWIRELVKIEMIWLNSVRMWMNRFTKSYWHSTMNWNELILTVVNRLHAIHFQLIILYPRRSLEFIEIFDWMFCFAELRINWPTKRDRSWRLGYSPNKHHRSSFQFISCFL